MAVLFFAVLLTPNLFAQDLRLSIPLPLTGPQAKFGEIEKNSYIIAMEEINAAGGIKGKKSFSNLRTLRGNRRSPGRLLKKSSM